MDLIRNKASLGNGLDGPDGVIRAELLELGTQVWRAKMAVLINLGLTSDAFKFLLVRVLQR